MRSKRYLKFIVQPLVFLAALFVSYRMINHETQVEKEELAAAEMPVLYVSYGDFVLNELHGYASEMKPALMRGVITPITNDYTVNLDIAAQDAGVKEVRYRVLEPDGSRVLEEGSAAELEAKAGRSRAELSFSRGLTDNAEYMCEICVTDENGKNAYYYTRIGNYSNAHFEECLDLAWTLHRSALKGKKNVLAGSMEPQSGRTDDLSCVTINSSLDLVCFGDLEIEEAGDPVVSVQEMNNEYSLIMLDYRLTCTRDDGPVYYDVSECYRLRYSTQKVYLLNFDRTMEQLYLGSVEPGSGVIDLGIRADSVDFDSSESGNRISFIQNGQLWEYSLDDNTMTRVYGFRAMDGTADAQNDWRSHKIRILQTDESGNLDFAVTGYQNRGSREGQSGIGLFHYDSASQTVQELAFLDRKASPQLVKEEIGELAYLSGEGVFYFSAGGSIWAADTGKGTLRQFLEAVSEDYAISAGGRYLAWTDPAAGSRAGVLHVTDLEHKRTEDLIMESGSYVRPLGFMEDDCIYGVAAEKDLKRAAYDPGLFPMRRVVIYGCEGGETLKEYSRKGYFYSGAGISEKGNITLSCLRYKDGQFHEAADQSIKNQQMISKQEITVAAAEEDTGARSIRLQLLGQVPQKQVRLIEPGYSFGGSVSALEPAAKEEAYYVSARGDVILLTGDLADAVTQADANYGVVTDYRQRVIWSRAKSASLQAFSVPEAGGEDAEEKACRSMLAAMGISAGDGGTDGTVLENLRASVKKGEILDLTGCRVDLVLYYVSAGYPVYAKTAGGAALINGYTTSAVSYYDCGSGQQMTASLADAEEFFAAAGSVYYAYLSR